jgi:hypothetical protein
MPLFPSGPANGATANVNGYQFTFDSTANAWNRTQSFTGNLAVTTIIASGNITGGNLLGALANGNSNVSITANANVAIAVTGANRLVVTSTGANIAGTLNATGNANVGNLGTTTAVITTGNITTINSGLLQNGNSNVSITANANVAIAVTGANRLVVTSTGANLTGTLSVSGPGAANVASLISTGNISGNPNTSANIWKQSAFVANGGFGGGIALQNSGGTNDGYMMYLTSTPSQLNIQYGSNGGNTGSAGVTLTSTATSWSAFSDERLKTDLQPIANAIQKSSTLRTVTGRYKTDPEGTVRSFLIAQDVLPVVPSAVSTNEDGMLLLSRDELIPLLFATVNELSAQVAELKTEVNNLKNP